MEVIELIEEMRNTCEKLRQKGHQLRFVPTMGAIHDGHASLIQRASTDRGDIISEPVSSPASFSQENTFQNNEPKPVKILNSTEVGDNVNNIVVIVSIFVNPKQFNNPKDFANYPNTLEVDLELCRKLNVDYVFAPTSNQMYPDRGRTFNNREYSNNNNGEYCMIKPPTNRLAKDLEGKSRPGHFEGMLTVVCKLFNIIRPHEAYFGEKDYQQLILVSNMVQDLNMNVRVRAVETVRDSDSLPLSSRNIRLSQKQRQVAPVMCKILCDAKEAIESSQLNDTVTSCIDIKTILYASRLATLALNLVEEKSELFEISYLKIRCAKDITKINYTEDCDFEGFDCENGCVRSQLSQGNSLVLNARLLISAVVGGVRLLDNIEVLLNLDKI